MSNYKKTLNVEIEALRLEIPKIRENIQSMKEYMDDNSLSYPAPEFTSVEDLYTLPETPYIEEFFTQAREELATLQCEQTVHTRSTQKLEEDFHKAFLEFEILDRERQVLASIIERHGEDGTEASMNDTEDAMVDLATTAPVESLEADPDMLEAAEIIVSLSAQENQRKRNSEEERLGVVDMSSAKTSDIVYRIKYYLDQGRRQMSQQRRIQAVTELFEYITGNEEVIEFIENYHSFVFVIKRKLREFYRDGLAQAEQWYEQLFHISLIEDDDI